MLVDIFGSWAWTSVRWLDSLWIDGLFLKTKPCVCRLINKNIAVSLKGDKA